MSLKNLTVKKTILHYLFHIILLIFFLLHSVYYFGFFFLLSLCFFPACLLSFLGFVLQSLVSTPQHLLIWSPGSAYNHCFIPPLPSEGQSANRKSQPDFSVLSLLFFFPSTFPLPCKHSLKANSTPLITGKQPMHEALGERSSITLCSCPFKVKRMMKPSETHNYITSLLHSWRCETVDMVWTVSANFVLKYCCASVYHLNESCYIYSHRYFLIK